MAGQPPCFSAVGEARRQAGWRKSAHQSLSKVNPATSARKKKEENQPHFHFVSSTHTPVTPTPSRRVIHHCHPSCFNWIINTCKTPHLSLLFFFLLPLHHPLILLIFASSSISPRTYFRILILISTHTRCISKTLAT